MSRLEALILVDSQLCEPFSNSDFNHSGVIYYLLFSKISSLFFTTLLLATLILNQIGIIQVTCFNDNFLTLPFAQ